MGDTDTTDTINTMPAPPDNRDDTTVDDDSEASQAITDLDVAHQRFIFAALASPDIAAAAVDDTTPDTPIRVRAAHTGTTADGEHTYTYYVDIDRLAPSVANTLRTDTYQFELTPTSHTTRPVNPRK